MRPLKAKSTSGREGAARKWGCVCVSLGSRDGVCARLCVEIKSRVGRAGRGRDPRPPSWFPQLAQVPTHPSRGLLGGAGGGQEAAEQPVPKQHPRCPDALPPLHVGQEHGEALEDEAQRGPRGWEWGGWWGGASLPRPTPPGQLPGASQAPAEEAITMVASHTVG